VAAHADQIVRAEGATDLMKRAHRKSHLMLWLILGPVMFATIILAVLNRPAAPVNDALPDALIEEVR